MSTPWGRGGTWRDVAECDAEGGDAWRDVSACNAQGGDTWRDVSNPCQRGLETWIVVPNAMNRAGRGPFVDEDAMVERFLIWVWVSEPCSQGLGMGGGYVGPSWLGEICGACAKNDIDVVLGRGAGAEPGSSLLPPNPPLLRPASVQDRDDAVPVIEQPVLEHSNIQKIWVDGAYTGDVIHRLREATGIDVEVVKRTDDMRGFVVLPRRWVVERTLGWTERFRLLTREHERTISSSSADVYCAMSMLLAQRLTSSPDSALDSNNSWSTRRQARLPA